MNERYFQSDRPNAPEIAAPRKQSDRETAEKAFFHQAAIKGYETEIENLKKEIEQIQETSKV